MKTFRRIFVVAALAGFIGGVFTTVVHQVATVPVILDAEVFERSAESETSRDSVPPSDGALHEREADSWKPHDRFERAAYTALTDISTGIGFALLLVIAYVIKGGGVGWRKGLCWGLAGFAAVALAPGLGLPPEVPGTQAAPLLARQTWWIATVASTATGLALIFLGRRAILALSGVALIVLPHAYGVPQPAEHSSVVPEILEHRFIVAVAVTSLLFWLSLGALSGFFYERVFRED